MNLRNAAAASRAAGTLNVLRHHDARRLGRPPNERPPARAHATLSNTMYVDTHGKVRPFTKPSCER